uniref:Uncharacterized protein n=1 Tax=Arundo donax TaxID=35708 RepID=A0A0A9CL13_ARUDO
MVYAIEAEPVVEEGAEELATKQDTTNPEPAQVNRCNLTIVEFGHLLAAWECRR